jgi:pimeloyl-ACP methyl ester carboxylesterase
VVIEQGAGELSEFWWPVQDEIPKFAQVCTYDRAGYGLSEPGRAGGTIEDRTRELHTLLSTAGVQGPFIFVAHSYGGLIVRNYVREYPGQVAALVFVDTPSESSIFQSEVLDLHSKARVINRGIGFVSRFGVLRLLSHWLPLDRFGLISCRHRNLELTFTQRYERTVDQDNTVRFHNLTMQIERAEWRPTLAGCKVIIHQHLDQTLTLTIARHRVGHYSAEGKLLTPLTKKQVKAVEKTLRGKVTKQTFPLNLQIPQTTWDSHFPTASTTTDY